MKHKLPTRWINSGSAILAGVLGLVFVRPLLLPYGRLLAEGGVVVFMIVTALLLGYAGRKFLP